MGPSEVGMSASESGGSKKLVISDDDLANSPVSSPNPNPPVQPPTGAKAKKTIPTAPESPPAQRSWLQRHGKKLLIGGVGAAALLVGFIVAFVALGLFDDSETNVSGALGEANSAFMATATDVIDSSDRHRQLTALQNVAAKADEQAAQIDKESNSVKSDVDDGRLANPALDLMAAESDFLTRLSAISRLKDSELQRGAQDLSTSLKRINTRIAAARKRVSGLGLASSEPLAPSAKAVSATIDTSHEVLIASAQALAAWQRRVDQARAQAQGGLQVAESYRSTMSSLIDQYFEQRNSTRALMERQGVLWNEASQQLRSMADARASIISQMQGLTVPAEAQSAHTQMVSLASRSQSLLEQAATETESDAFIVWTGSPGYNRLSEGSDQITGEFDPAKQAVLSAADQAVTNAQGQALPPKPEL
jgi:hypothetical protein